MIETSRQREKREKSESAGRVARQERYLEKNGGTVAKGPLAECEEVIARGLNSFIEVGNALLRIREERLYKEKYSSFEDYCEERWKISKSHANRLIGSSCVAANLAPMGVTIASERVARPLVSLPPDSQRTVFKAAVKSSRNGKPTARDVQTAVDRTLNRRPTESEKTGTGLGSLYRETIKLVKANWKRFNLDEQEAFREFSAELV
ncbi:MAG TPA: hypothetical protein VGI59_09535 [Candidatus Udaeobacter sp.]|jgi:hypothetical protein